MRIVHCCLAAFYIDNYGYQENILPKHHKLQGYDVKIIASTETYLKNRELGYTQPREYFNENGIKVVRLPYHALTPGILGRKLRVYGGLYSQLIRFKPDIIFLHDIQFLSIYAVVKYVRSRPEVKVYADGHTDFINSARGFISRYVLHAIVYRLCAKMIEPYVIKFFGVTPARVDFFREMYGLPANKLELLVLGYDDAVQVDTSAIKNRFRSEHGIDKDDIVFFSGGKIDKRKNIVELIQAFLSSELSNAKLVIFGEPNEEMQYQYQDLKSSPNVIFLGWIGSDQVRDVIVSCDIGVFPGTHSVLWEQTVGLGVPAIFRKWEGMTHIDVGGNCIFLEKGSIDEIKNALVGITLDPSKLDAMKKVAEDVGRSVFSYSSIAKKAIGLK